VTAQKHKSSASNNNPKTKTQERDNMNKLHGQTNSGNNVRVVKLSVNNTRVVKLIER